MEYELNDDEVAQWRDIGALNGDGSAVTRADGAPDDVDYTGQTDTYLWTEDNRYGVPSPEQEQPVTVHLLSEDAGITASVPYISQYNEDGDVSEIVRTVVGFDDEGRAYWRDDDGTLKRITQVNYDGDVWPREVLGWTDDGQVISVTRKERATVSDGQDPDYVPGAESGIEHAAGLASQVEGGRAEGEGLTIEYTDVIIDGKEYELTDEEVEQLENKADGRPSDVSYSGESVTHVGSDGVEYTVHLLEDDAGVTATVLSIPTYNDGEYTYVQRAVVGFDDEGWAYWRDSDGTLRPFTLANRPGDAQPRSIVGWTNDGQPITVTDKTPVTVTHTNPNYQAPLPEDHPARTDPNHPNYRGPEQPGEGDGANTSAADGTPEVDPNAAPVETPVPTPEPTLSPGSGFFEQDTVLDGSLGTVEEAEADAAAHQERQEQPPPPQQSNDDDDDDDDDDSHLIKEDDAQGAEDTGGFGERRIHRPGARRQRGC